MKYINDINYFNYQTLQRILGFSAAIFSAQMLFNPVQSMAFIISASIVAILVIGFFLVRGKMKSYTQNHLSLHNGGLTIMNEEQILETVTFDSLNINYMKIKLSHESIWVSEKQFVEINTIDGSKTYYFQPDSPYNNQKVLELISSWKNNGIQVHQL